MGSPEEFSKTNKITSNEVNLPVHWNYMGKVSKPKPSGYVMCDLGALTGMSHDRLALSLTAYTCLLNFKVLHLKGTNILSFFLWFKEL